MVRQRQWKYFPLFNIYDITHTTDYDPNGREVSFFAKNILGFQLSEKLRKAVLKFNNQKALENQKVFDTKPSEPTKKVATRYQYQCSTCFTIYDSAFGDTLNNIPPGLSFLSLPKEYTCSICDAPKSSFQLKEVEDYLI
ncbi:UNVERIFIED_CONTAM: hypothetical protein GTU68_008657 [Idotea baltica]|nr:hypothetical protein [Idotea baltica]